ncbi:MAG: tRNA pseudouridine(38-40) synthase TruA [Candidatus Rhabdochlamydia sp.]
MNNIKLLIAYDGTCYLGWQKTKEGPSIEESVQKALEQILNHSVILQAASRTDRGVHAEGQVINFFTEKSVVMDSLERSLNALLPKDIRVLNAKVMPLSFHPTLSAQGKEYHYHVCLGKVQSPFHKLFSWHFVKPVHLSKIEETIPFLIGRRDFSALTNEKKEDNVCDLSLITVHSLENNRLVFHIQGNRFLYKMVRNIVGTLLYVGWGAILPSDIPKFLELQDRKKMGVTAPAHGLSLKRVFYD